MRFTPLLPDDSALNAICDSPMTVSRMLPMAGSLSEGKFVCDRPRKT